MNLIIYFPDTVRGALSCFSIHTNGEGSLQIYMGEDRFGKQNSLALCNFLSLLPRPCRRRPRSLIQRCRVEHTNMTLMNLWKHQTMDPRPPCPRLAGNKIAVTWSVVFLTATVHVYMCRIMIPLTTWYCRCSVFQHARG